MKYLPLEAWLAGTHRPICLDIRPPAEFAVGHLPAAGNVPLAELAARVHELPRKGDVLYVVGGPAAREAAALLAARGRWSVAWSDEDPAAWPAASLVAGPPAPLWRPSPWLEEHWRLIPAGGRVLDLGMGSGRNAVWLALRGFRVAGMDILPDAVAFARRLAERHGAALDAQVADLRAPGLLPLGTCDGLLVFDFLERELLPAMDRALAPGGVLLFETFTEKQARHAARPRNPRWLLRPGELYEAFAHLDIVAYREEEAEPGRWVASLAARRPA
ncbi:MAG: methyltransferase domain-containing protein [Candidatus Krumholzibacteriota bacterium]|nr:methyltransferase domain-containing protein [Candidatus Krumholzibacteriota bacterium]